MPVIIAIIIISVLSRRILLEGEFSISIKKLLELISEFSKVAE